MVRRSQHVHTFTNESLNVRQMALTVRRFMYILSPVIALKWTFNGSFPIVEFINQRKRANRAHRSIATHSHKVFEPQRTILPLIKPTYQLQNNVHSIEWIYGNTLGTRAIKRERTAGKITHLTLLHQLCLVTAFSTSALKKNLLTDRPYRYSLLYFEVHIFSSTSNYRSNKPY